MNDRLKLKLPKDRMKISEIEKWLGDMAAEGKILYKLKNDNVTFTEQEPKYINFKIIPFRGDMFYDERKVYEEKGYVRYTSEYDISSSDFRIHNIPYYVFGCTNPENSEKISDDILDDEYINKSHKKHRRNIAIRPFNFLIWFFYSLYMLLDSDNPSPHAIIVNFLFIVLVLLPFIVAMFLAIKRLSKEPKTVSLSEFDDPVFAVDNDRRCMKLGFIYIAVFIIFIVLNIYGNNPFSYKDREKDLRQFEEFISLDEIQNDEFVSDYMQEDLEAYTGMAVPTVFIPVHFSQAYYFRAENNSEEDIQIDYVYTYHKIRIPGVSKLAFKRWTKEAEEDAKYFGEVTYTSSEHFDKIAYYYEQTFEDTEILVICFSNKSEFVMIDYTGDVSVDELIEIVDKRLGEVH